MQVSDSIRYLITDESSYEYSYAGVGGPETPVEICMLFEAIARYLSAKGCILRSGGDLGGDSSFENEAVFKEIYLPYQNYNSKNSGLISGTDKKCIEIAKSVHPAWHRCSEFAKRCHARSVKIILGADYTTPARFLVCWTSDGVAKSDSVSARTGMSRVAISLALKMGIPVLNTGNASHRELLMQLVLPPARGGVVTSSERQALNSEEVVVKPKRKGFRNLK